MKKYYRNENKTAWYDFEPDDLTGLIEVTEEEYKDSFKVERDENKIKLHQLKKELASYDYIGVKIAMGVATKEDYADEIAYTETLRKEIRKLEK